MHSEEKDMDVKENFYNEQDQAYEILSRYGIKIIVGGGNEKIGT